MGHSDRRLVQRVLAGDRTAAEALAERHRPDLVNLFLWLTRDADLSESLAQETFLRSWERLAQFRGESSLRTWMHSVALSVLAQHRRDDARESRALEQYAAETAGRGRQQAEQRVALAHALAQLPELERRAIVLCKLQGFTLAEAAGLLGEPVGTLAWRVAEGLKRLRVLLSGEQAPANAGQAKLTQEGTPDVSQGS